MSDIAIRAENLGKAYQITHSGSRSGYKTLQEDVLHLLRRPFTKSDGASRRETFWALKDVSFEVRYGEVLGIIGRNGAGKSTLLKILSRITKPTTGRADIYGRVGSLLEVGTGFHPELTGRENIFLNGAVLGMTRRDIQKRFDEIVAFAEVEQFLDTPVKRYSSGMYMRLAFAIAAHLEPEVLVVDEVLAVGDAAFQKKCLGKMEDVAKSGRTVLFVSHQMNAVRSLCTSGLLLQKGRTEGKKALGSVVDEYLRQGMGDDHLIFPVIRDDIVIHSFMLSQGGVALQDFDGAKPIQLQVELEVCKPLSYFRIGVYWRTSLGEILFRSFAADWNAESETLQPGRYLCTALIPGNFLAPDNYIVELHASRYGIGNYLIEQDVNTHIRVEKPVDFNAVHPDEPDVPGLVITNLQWELRTLSRE